MSLNLIFTDVDAKNIIFFGQNQTILDIVRHQGKVKTVTCKQAVPTYRYFFSLVQSTFQIFFQLLNNCNQLFHVLQFLEFTCGNIFRRKWMEERSNKKFSETFYFWLLQKKKCWLNCCHALIMLHQKNSRKVLSLLQLDI